VSRDAPFKRGIWTEDEEFFALTPHGKLLYVWGFTNKHGSWSGLYRVVRSVMASETGLTGRQLGAALEDVRAPGLMLYERGVVWIRGAIKNCPYKTENMAKGIRADVERIPADHPLRVRLLTRYGDFPWLRGTLADLEVPGTENGSIEPGTVTLGKGSEGSIGPPTTTTTPTTSSSEEQLTSVEPPEFADWLEHHESVTGHRPPRPGTKARAKVLAAFRARLGESYSLDDLKLATLGAFNDPNRRENGWYTTASVLYGEKCHDLVEKGRRAAKQNRPAKPAAEDLRCRGCGDSIDVFRFRNRSRLCEGCQLREDEAA
jgi:hypothetical protein